MGSGASTDTPKGQLVRGLSLGSVDDQEPATPRVVLQKQKVKLGHSAREQIDDHVSKLDARVSRLGSPDALDAIRAIEDFPNARSCEGQGNLRESLADYLVELNYHAVCLEVILSVKTPPLATDDHPWELFYLTMRSMWNFSDSSIDFCKALAETQCVPVLRTLLSQEKYLDALMENKRVNYVLKASLGILLNIAQHTDLKHHFRAQTSEESILKVVLSYTTMREAAKDLRASPTVEKSCQMMTVMAYLILASLVEEDEKNQDRNILDHGGVIDFLISSVKEALDDPKRSFNGFQPAELFFGLSKLANADCNKLKIVEAGGLAVLVRALERGGVEDQGAALELVWSLAFSDGVRAKLTEQAGGSDQMDRLLHLISELRQSEVPEIKDSAGGFLFTLRHCIVPRDRRATLTTEQRNEGHIFVSYSHDNKDTVSKVVEKLTADGHQVWFDRDKIAGDSHGSMADGIEKAKWVLICMSERYQESDNCKLEAQYAFQCGKPFIPLKMQSGFRATKWLGFMLGTQIYVDFTGEKFPFVESIERLLEQVHRRFGTELPNQI